MRLTEALVAIVGPEPTDATAVLALSYADAIDQANHLPLGMADALDTLRAAAAAADVANGDDKAGRAFRKVAAAVSSATILASLGPKLLVALDSVPVTPKEPAEPAATPPEPVNPLDELRNRRDTRSARAG